MAKNAANDISFYLVLDVQHKDDLSAIRPWSNLKIAYEGNQVWVKDLDYAQANSVEVKSIPYKTVFYESGGKLFLQHSNLPDRNVPSLLWTAVDRALPVKIPSLNHNYFGLSEKLSVQIVPSGVEEAAVAMIADISALEQYIQQAPAVRLKQLQWCILNGSHVLLYGKPLLPIDGMAYWQRGRHLIPAGKDFDLFLLGDALGRVLDPDNDSLIGWNEDSTYFMIERSDLQLLSLSAFRLSMQELTKKSAHGF